jgi:hypothetical protein
MYMPEELRLFKEVSFKAKTLPAVTVSDDFERAARLIRRRVEEGQRELTIFLDISAGVDFGKPENLAEAARRIAGIRENLNRRNSGPMTWPAELVILKEGAIVNIIASYETRPERVVRRLVEGGIRTPRAAS